MAGSETENTVDFSENGAQAGKLPYKAPALVTYGSVRELTRSGFGTGADGGTDPTMLMVSDPAFKENAVQIGVHPAGFGIYLYDYKAEFRDRFGHGRQFGVMADEVERIVPDAVSLGSDGYRRVNYAAIGVTQH